jgi:hypothetical protein
MLRYYIVAVLPSLNFVACVMRISETALINSAVEYAYGSTLELIQ